MLIWLIDYESDGCPKCGDNKQLLTVPKSVNNLETISSLSKHINAVECK